jgi:hypothetical protein
MDDPGLSLAPSKELQRANQNTNHRRIAWQFAQCGFFKER